jgi:hypothetical protein
MRRSKNEERGTYELKREHAIQLDEIKQKLSEKDEGIDYYKTKTEKLETENQSLRTGKGDNKKVRELENEVEMLKSQLRDQECGV